ncbi:MAG: recombination protein RecR [Gammaproteobacteria bacterium]|nr:recombination protein RecR [Gammaproteobacteria bacterium]
MFLPAQLEQLIEALRVLPGVGPKSAQRMAYHLLERHRDEGRRLSRVLLQAMDEIKNCRDCRSFSDAELCPLCASNTRDRSIICVVESPADVAAVEQSIGYQGRYFVLMGHLSPLDGIGPDELGMEVLIRHMNEGEVKEIILATNPTVEGEATAHFIAELARDRGIKASRIAHGVPLGGELEYLDGGTLSHAFAGRREV